VVIFGYEGVDEMEPASGGGWMQLLDAARGTLEGEFLGALGRFTARRQAGSPARAADSLPSLAGPAPSTWQ
jgi:hypothetical protein